MGATAASASRPPRDGDDHALSEIAPALCCLCRSSAASETRIELVSKRVDEQSLEVADSKPVFAAPALDTSPTTTSNGLKAASLLEGVDVGPDEHDEAVTTPSAQFKPDEQNIRISVTEVQQRAVAATTSSASLKHPDFNGTWKMVAFEGDFEAFMKEMGVAWAFRKAAGAVGYGVGATFHAVKHDASSIHVETKNPKGTFIRDLQIDGSEQDDVDPMQKRPIKVVPYWEVADDCLVLTLEAYMPMPSGDPRKLPRTRRYMRDGSMIVEQVSPGGLLVKRVFQRQ